MEEFNRPIINSLIISFLGGNQWMIVFGVMYSLWASNDMYACHMHCGLSTDINPLCAAAIASCANTLKERSKKFNRRRFTLCNLRPCGNPVCMFNTSTTIATKEEHSKNKKHFTEVKSLSTTQHRYNKVPEQFLARQEKKTMLVYRKKKWNLTEYDPDVKSPMKQNMMFYSKKFTCDHWFKPDTHKKKYCKEVRLSDKQNQAYDAMHKEMTEHEITKMMGINPRHATAADSSKTKQQNRKAFPRPKKQNFGPHKLNISTKHRHWKDWTESDLDA